MNLPDDLWSRLTADNLSAPLQDARTLMNRKLRSALFSLMAVLLFVTLCAAAHPPPPQEQTLQFLNQTIDWYRRVSAIGRSGGSSQDLLYRESVQKESRSVVSLAFRFAQSEAEFLDAQSPALPSTAPNDDRARRLAARLNTTRKHIAELQSRLDALDLQIGNGAATTRPALAEERASAASQMNFAMALRDTLTQLTDFNARVQSGSQGSLQKQVDDLIQSVPEIQTTDADSATSQPAATPVPAGEAFHPESAGIVRLTTQLFSLTQQMGDLTSLANQTSVLAKENDDLRNPIRTQLLTAVARADQLAATTQAATAPQQAELNALTEKFRSLSAALVPLDGQKLMLDRTHATLLEWRARLAQEYGSTLRHLLIRLAIMGAVILFVLAISALWRHATFKYVRDSRRQRQFLLLRRIVVGIVVILVFVAGFVAEFGSLATFAGIITAGIAVAMQTVILSAVAYFFYIGRYGVRVGDRVTVSGVTGDVVDIGLFRLYLMELGGVHLKQKPTGRIAVFSNSVLFAATGFFRQIPGADYGWHEIALTLAPAGDYKLAEKRLMAAVESVYSEYHQDIDRQHVAANEAFHLSVPEPKPEGRLRLIEAGLEFILRYPVALRHGAETDDRMTRALLDAIEKEPSLKVVASGTPTVQPAG